VYVDRGEGNREQGGDSILENDQHGKVAPQGCLVGTWGWIGQWRLENRKVGTGMSEGRKVR